MWEVLVRTPLGRHSLRKFMMSFATLLVAVFSYTIIASTPVFAADASWKDDETLTYDGADYNGPGVADDKFPSIPTGSIVYVSAQPDDSKANVIFFPPDVADSYHSQDQAQFLTYTYTDTNGPDTAGGVVLSDPTEQILINVSPRAPPAGANDSDAGSGSCNVEGGLGWMVCPITNTLAQAMDAIYGMIAQFLKVQPLLLNTDNPLYRAWDLSKNLANIAFIIALLIIIYAQVSGGLMTNYMLKKLIPRVVIAGILVNLSYYICAIAVDLSNILGYAVSDLFITVRDTVGISGNVDFTDPINATSIAAIIIGGGAATLFGVSAVITAGFGAVWIFLAMLIPFFFVVLVSFLILAARQALITILIVVAPLALVAYLLPNTEKWFERWRNLLFTLLIMFPAFSAVFGGSQLAAALIISGNTGGSAVTGDFLMVMLAWGVQVAPLAITPLLLKLGGGLLNRFAGIVNSPTKGVFDRAKNWSKDRGDLALARGRSTSAMRFNQGRLSGARRADAWRTRGRLAREGEKSAREAMLKGSFTQTAQGQRVHRLGERAKLEQGYGDHHNQAAWENEVRTTPYLRNRTLQSHDAHSRAELYKGEVDSAANEHWQHHLQHDVGLRNIQTQTHLQQGRANLTEESLKNANERTLQTEINQTAGLRNMKIQSDVDAAHAQFQAANVAAEGKVTFQREVFGDRALKLMNVETTAFEKEAGTIENILKSQAETRWNQASRRDPEFQRLRLEESRSADMAKKAELQWDSIVEQARSKGGNAERVDVANRDIAANMQGLAVDISAHSSAIEQIKDEQKGHLLERLNADQQLRDVAGGGTKFGATKVLAKSQEGMTKMHLENVKAQNSIFSNEGVNVDEMIGALLEGNQTLRGEPVDTVIQHAAIQYVMEEQGNNWAVSKMVDLNAEQQAMEMVENDDGTVSFYDAKTYREAMRSVENEEDAVLPPELSKDEVSSRRDFMQMVVGGYRNGKNKLSWFSATNQERANRGLSSIDWRLEKALGREVDASEAAIISEIMMGKYEAKRIAEMDPDELARMIQVLRDEKVRKHIPQEKLDKVLEKIINAQSSELYRDGIKDRERSLMDTLASYINLGQRDNPDEEALREMENFHSQVTVTDADGRSYQVWAAPETANAVRSPVDSSAPNVYSYARQDDIRPSGRGLNPPRQ